MGTLKDFASALAGRGWKDYANARRRLERRGSADAVLNRLSAARSDIGAWNADVAASHDAYRALLDAPDGEIAVVCVSNRPHLIELVVANIERQHRRPDDVIVLLNVDEPPIEAVERRLADLKVGGRVKVLHAPASNSLGRCLNIAMEATDARFVAKFDDDDYYGPMYLADMLGAHGYAGAGIVGKHTWYAHLEETDETILRFPGHEFTYTATLAGATLVIDRDQTGGLGFRHLSIGEDRAFIRDCNRRGISTFAADRFNFLVRRDAHNSWAMTREAFIEKSIILGSGRQLDEVDR